MINTLRWYTGGWLLKLAYYLCGILDTLDPLCFQIRNPLRRAICLVPFFLFGVIPAFLMVCIGGLIVGEANVQRIDDLEGDIL
jgi:hypothetical protein